MSTQPQVARHRRAPRLGRFMATGLLLAGIIAFIVAIITAGQSETTTSNIFWVQMLYLGPIGLFLGALVAYLLDRKSIKRMEEQRIAAEDLAQATAAREAEEASASDSEAAEGAPAEDTPAEEAPPAPTPDEP